MPQFFLDKKSMCKRLTSNCKQDVCEISTVKRILLTICLDVCDEDIVFTSPVI